MVLGRFRSFLTLVRTNEKYISTENKSHYLIFFPIQQMKQCGGSRFFSQNVDKLIIFKIRTVELTQPAITCSKLTIKVLEQGVKYVQS